jgi:hypothetical protein
MVEWGLLKCVALLQLQRLIIERWASGVTRSECDREPAMHHPPPTRNVARQAAPAQQQREIPSLLSTIVRCHHKRPPNAPPNVAQRPYAPSPRSQEKDCHEGAYLQTNPTRLPCRARGILGRPP